MAIITSPSATTDSQACSVCLDRPVALAFLPCNHRTCCEECYLALPRQAGRVLCPLCRTPIEDTDDEQLARAMAESLSCANRACPVGRPGALDVQTTPSTGSVIHGESPHQHGLIRPSSSNPARQRRRRQQAEAAAQEGATREAEASVSSSHASLQAKLRERRPPQVILPRSTAEQPGWSHSSLRPAAECAPTGPAGSAPPVLVWIRLGDLRLRDNPALHAASESGAPVVPVFIAPPESEEGGWPVTATGSEP